MTGRRSAMLAPSLPADMARQRAFSEVLSLLADHEDLPPRELTRRVAALARAAGAAPDAGRELAACRRALDGVLDALAAIEDRLASFER